MKTFKENMNLNVIKSDSQTFFLGHLENIYDPEQKKKSNRKNIHRYF
ncbi:MAG: hypothetical protein CM15mP76_13560 [Prochlorococcus sp.]|nr:MAG: hypothetical protein CM15mP76_13560 [Prochlorococcus sp.]